MKALNSVIGHASDCVQYRGNDREREGGGGGEREIVVIVLKIALGRLDGPQSVSRRPVQRKSLVLPATERDRPARNRSLQYSLVVTVVIRGDQLEETRRT